MMIKSIFHILLIGLVLFFSIKHLSGISLEIIGDHTFATSFGILVGIFSVIEIALHPVIKLLLLPVRIITFGIVSIVVSIGLIYTVAFLLPLFSVTSLWQAFLLAAAFGVIQKILK